MGTFVNARTDAANSAIKATEARTQGLVQRQQAYQKAYGLESDSAQEGYMSALQMGEVRERQIASVAASRAAAAASGFDASSGTKLGAETSVLDMFEQQLSNMTLSHAINDSNAREQANELRREGDTALTLANIQSNYYKKVAKSQRNASWGYLVGNAFTKFGDFSATYGLDDKLGINDALFGKNDKQGGKRQ